MIVVAIIVILALIALPGIPDKLIRDRITESLKLTDIVKAPIAASWAIAAKLPVDNAAAGLPAADKIVSDYVSSVAVESGHLRQPRQRRDPRQGADAAARRRRRRADRAGDLDLRRRRGGQQDDGQGDQQDHRADALSAAELPAERRGIGALGPARHRREPSHSVNRP